MSTCGQVSESKLKERRGEYVKPCKNDVVQFCGLIVKCMQLQVQTGVYAYNDNSC